MRKVSRRPVTTNPTAPSPSRTRPTISDELVALALDFPELGAADLAVELGISAVRVRQLAASERLRLSSGQRGPRVVTLAGYRDVSRAAHGELPTRALSVSRPWATQIVFGSKRVENRRWRTNFRGPIWIHESGREGRGLLGTVVLADVIPADEALKRFPKQERWIQGPWCWLVINPTRLATPFPCAGALSLWHIDRRILHAAQRRM